MTLLLLLQLFRSTVDCRFGASDTATTLDDAVIFAADDDVFSSVPAMMVGNTYYVMVLAVRRQSRDSSGCLRLFGDLVYPNVCKKEGKTDETRMDT